MVLVREGGGGGGGSQSFHHHQQQFVVQRQRSRNKEICGVELSFYNDDDVRERSVKEITESESYDPNGNATIGGTYDPHLGPTTTSSKSSNNNGMMVDMMPCPTCSLGTSLCPGHFGHIELIVPIYQPLLFRDYLLQVLRMKCYYCHELKIDIHRIHIWKSKFNLLLCMHNIQQCRDLDHTIMKTVRENIDDYYMQVEGSNNSHNSNNDPTKKRKTLTKKMDDDVGILSKSLNKNQVKSEQLCKALRDILHDIQPRDPTRRKEYNDNYYDDDEDDNDEDDNDDDDDDMEEEDDNDNNNTNSSNSNSSFWTSFVCRQYYVELVKECFVELRTSTKENKCSHCYCINPKIRHDHHNKIFQCALSKKAMKYNRHIIGWNGGDGGGSTRSSTQKYHPISAMYTIQKRIMKQQEKRDRKKKRIEEEFEKKKKKQQQEKEEKKRTKQRDGLDSSSSSDDDDDDNDEVIIMSDVDNDDDDNNNDSDDTDRENDDNLDGNNNNNDDNDNMDDANGVDSDLDDDDDDDDDGVRPKSGGTATTTTGKDRYMHPGEVRAQLQLLWEKEPFLCNALFALHRAIHKVDQQLKQGLQLSDDDDDDDDEKYGEYDNGEYDNKRCKNRIIHRRRRRKKQLRKKKKKNFTRENLLLEQLHDRNGYDVFFMQCIPITPNRFRPPLGVGDSVVIHAQTNYYNQVIIQNKKVRDHLAILTSNSSTNKNNTSSHESAAYQSWIELQTAVNSYMDNTLQVQRPKPPLKVHPHGIRQLLEKKTGLLRGNMMGKRVNYCCRSVISPDPYIGSNQIGIPQHFAKILTFPTTVTLLNIQEMKQLIINGCYHYPGARWIEIHDGDGTNNGDNHVVRRIDFRKMNLQKRKAIAARLLAYVTKGQQQPHQYHHHHQEQQQQQQYIHNNKSPPPTGINNENVDNDDVGVSRYLLGSSSNGGNGKQQHSDHRHRGGGVMNGDHYDQQQQQQENNHTTTMINHVVIGRQMRDGDYVLMNRQPTLHKPGIMAHRVRVLRDPTQKTIRMHYANCNAYNADFDGDEMNCHFSQDMISQTEAKYIAKTDQQYIVATDGTPLRGLIQDHVVGGVKLTTKNTFFERWKYMQLLQAAFTTVEGIEDEAIIPPSLEIEIVPPAIRKPVELWTGKQVISTILLNLRRKRDGFNKNCIHDDDPLPGISCVRKSKTPETAFGSEQDEHLVLIRDGELLRGVLDKAAFGATNFSLVHAVYEAYGALKAGILLDALGRLFTSYIQSYSGHSCRVEDLVLTKESDRDRWDLIQKSYNIGSRAAKAWADSEGGKVPIASVKDQPGSDIPMKPYEIAQANKKIGELLSGKEGNDNFAALDGYMQGQLNPLSSDIVKKCLPSGLAVPFPINTFSVMTTTGAKGSIVNQSQVTCALGQQALEGRRVPRMSSGKTLPSFAPYDVNPRSDGFVLDRFLTGIRPQEYYFHCMAGREGLVDTAVKTSRSGYLQRCLMKHLEELKIHYDSTVRNSNNDVIQFLYGEDALDPMKASYLDCSDSSFEFMARNYDALATKNASLPNSTVRIAADDAVQAAKVEEAATPKPTSATIDLDDDDDDDDERMPFSEGDHVLARRLRSGTEWQRGMLLKGWHRAIVRRVCKEAETVDLVYGQDGVLVKEIPLTAHLGPCGSKGTKALTSIATLVKPNVPDPIMSSLENGHRLGVSGACVSERIARSAMEAIRGNDRLKSIMSSSIRANGKKGITEREMSKLVSSKFSNSICSPGESVGTIAAQSVGEPSTQMTLNTFHLAGSGANVTLGIPRLREIIMTASRIPKTPTMSVPIRPWVSDQDAVRLTNQFTKITLMDLLASHRGVAVSERLELDEYDSGNWVRAYYVSLKLHPEERIKAAFGLSLRDVCRVVAKPFAPLLTRYMKDEMKRASTETETIGTKAVRGGMATESGKRREGVEDGEFDGDADLRDDDGGPSRTTPKGKDGAGAADGDNGDDDDGGEDDAPGEEDGADASKYKSRSDDDAHEEDADEEDDDNDNDNSSHGGDDDDSYHDNDSGSSGSGSASSDDETSVRGTDDDRNDAIEEEEAIFAAPDAFSPSVIVKANCIVLQPLRVDPATRPLLMVHLVEKAASNTVVRAKKKVEKGYVNDEKGTRGRCLQTAGINFEEICKLESVDHDRLLTNDIWATRLAYGVEAARCNIVEQIRAVFGVYGIEVDPRHLSLIADFMTANGDYRAMSRTGMKQSSSSLLQMTYESTFVFMKQAALLSAVDDLESPSANIIVGRHMQHGTGSFSLLGGYGTGRRQV